MILRTDESNVLPLHFTTEINAECVNANNSRWKLLAHCVDCVIGCIEHIVNNSARFLFFMLLPVYLVSLKPKNIKYVTAIENNRAVKTFAVFSVSGEDVGFARGSGGCLLYTSPSPRD